MMSFAPGAKGEFCFFGISASYFWVLSFNSTLWHSGLESFGFFTVLWRCSSNSESFYWSGVVKPCLCSRFRWVSLSLSPSLSEINAARVYLFVRAVLCDRRAGSLRFVSKNLIVDYQYDSVLFLLLGHDLRLNRMYPGFYHLGVVFYLQHTMEWDRNQFCFGIRWCLLLQTRPRSFSGSVCFRSKGYEPKSSWK